MLELCCAHPKGLRELGAETDENQSHIPKPPALVLNSEWSLSGRKGKRLQVAQRAFIDGQQTKLNVNFYSRITTSKGSQTETWSTDHAEHTNSEETQHPRLQKKNKNIISSGLFILEFWLYGSKIKRIFVEWKICSGSGKALGKSGGTTLTHRWWWCHVDLSSFIIAECRTSALSIALQTENKQRRLHWWSEFSREQKPWAQKGSADNRKCWRKHLGTALCTVVRSIWLHVFPLDSFWRCWGVVARLRFLWVTVPFLILVHACAAQSSSTRPLPRTVAAPSATTSASLSASPGCKRAWTSSSAWCGQSRSWRGAELWSPSPTEKIHSLSWWHLQTFIHNSAPQKLQTRQRSWWREDTTDQQLAGIPFEFATHHTGCGNQNTGCCSALTRVNGVVMGSWAEPGRTGLSRAAQLKGRGGRHSGQPRMHPYSGRASHLRLQHTHSWPTRMNKGSAEVNMIYWTPVFWKG